MGLRRNMASGPQKLMRPHRVLALTFLLLAFAMLAGAVSVAFAGGGLVESASRAFFRFTCHGMDSRSLIVAGGSTMAICARCTGIWIGVFAACAYVLSGGATRVRISAPVALAFALPLIVDGVTQALGFRESTNLLRLATGFPAGLVPMLWAVQSVIPGMKQVRGTEVTAVEH